MDKLPGLTANSADSITALPSSVLSLNELLPPPDQQLLEQLICLVTADLREQAAKDLARMLGSEDLLIFVPDVDLDVLLPAPGFPQTLPDGRLWTGFLRDCVPGSIRRSSQTFPGSSHSRSVIAVTAQDGAVLVLGEDNLNAQKISLVVTLLPLVSAALRGEQAAQIAQAQVMVAELAASNAESLAKTLDTTRQELQHALTAAQRALRTRDEFLSIAAHELKTPLTALKLQVELVQLRVRRQTESTPFTQQISNLVDRIGRSLERLATLTEDLLDISRIQAGHLQLRLEPVDLVEVAREVVERFAAEADKRGCALTLQSDEPVQGLWDHSRLDQVITNLVTNALIYAGGTPITLLVVNTPGGARLEVRDGGPGIAPEDRERVFHRFERARPMGEGSGLGLGLHITREIVHAHDGHIFVDSSPGPGATFVVQLPHCPGAAGMNTAT